MTFSGHFPVRKDSGNPAPDSSVSGPYIGAAGNRKTRFRGFTSERRPRLSICKCAVRSMTSQ